MKNCFLPDRYFDTVYALSPAFLTENGIKALVCDIDNTLVTYDDPKPTPAVWEWLQALQKAGIRVAFISNNEAQRVNLFNEDLGYYAIYKAAKPKTAALRQFMKEFGYQPGEVAEVGDQIFTDVLMAKRSGCQAYLVPPIKDRTDWFHRLKRLGEKPLMRRYFRLEAKQKEK